MGFKVFIILSFFLAVALPICSDEAARNLVDTSVDNKNVNANSVMKSVNWWAGIYGGYPGQVGAYGGFGGYHHSGNGYPGYPGYGGYGGGPGYRGGIRSFDGSCYYGCCRPNYYGRGCERCCSYFDEAFDAKIGANNPHN
ncbi:Glycine rich protein [Parasponia andersonii]|uniref:Glycine rich protein n=1 Tax=Parasponia andersonii TaxID=3476 RepID=A0A2P5D0P1_PARAD|nr:Glycine rich protein [Parasponia andersonii]